MIRGARQPENLFKFAVPVCDNVLCSPCDSDFFLEGISMGTAPGCKVKRLISRPKMWL